MNDSIEQVKAILQSARLFFQQRAELYGPELILPTAPTYVTAGKADLPEHNLVQLSHEIITCQKCGLHRTRRQVVFGSGNPHAILMVVGDAPSSEDEQHGQPFTGAVGELLDKILNAVQFQRPEVYLTHILKCKLNTPISKQAPDELRICQAALGKQIEYIQPKLILALGEITGQILLETFDPIEKLRGQVHFHKGIYVVVTYPPYLLNIVSAGQKELKRATWDDVQLLRKKYDELQLISKT
jgi:DNA polymerase